MIYQEHAPPASVGLPDAEGYYHFEYPTLGMQQGWYYLPWKLTERQYRWNAVYAAITIVSFFLGIFFLFTARRLPWTASKYIVISLVMVDRFKQVVTFFFWHMPSLFYGHFWHGGQYTCQLIGFAAGAWGVAGQSFLFLFMMEQYLAIVHRFRATNHQARTVVLGTWGMSLSMASVQFIFGRMAGLSPSGLYCQPLWSNGGDWVGALIGVLGFGFLGLNVKGIIFMYWRIYVTFIAVRNKVEEAIEGTLDRNAKAGKGAASGQSLSNSFEPTASIINARKTVNTGIRKDTNQLAFRLARQAVVYIGSAYFCMFPMWISIGYHMFMQMPPPAWMDYASYIGTYGFSFMNPILIMTLNQHWRAAALDEIEVWADVVGLGRYFRRAPKESQFSVSGSLPQSTTSSAKVSHAVGLEQNRKLAFPPESLPRQHHGAPPMLPPVDLVALA
ncbi:hypothetical protein DFS34DRAFT_611202 [Phlyctochytrium arcticum]|nr:hypothetical protein DFS34DRAFT_611202 [Phlyctochytrium arcticum]